MTHDPTDLTVADYLDGAREMAAAGRPVLAHLLAEEAARRVADPANARSIRAQYTQPTTDKG
ncbi:hypothetical protein OIC43_22220 [Streptomyces sp. NBC_00825]|uniref:hypothetical protein n=1 Tax=unclassified Streptomyces TaxID=2593676 RepID=UPI002ED2A9C1|nr:hypothetical protein OG832_21475 [Streptomyces sp. NBC_00826]WTH91569.1 hypothetical protein OIC43_22220 [Streptomyces sp. NBC_00825]WTI00297.1 hypothetical protein OHA23_22205 [Streptomyces sp. NBC_00822]